MSGDDVTIEVLKGIRAELQALRADTNQRSAETNERLAEANQRLDRVERRQTETEVRLSTELVALAGAVRDVRDLLRENLSVRDQVAAHERRIEALERRLG